MEKNKNYPVHCVKCGWKGRRTHAPLKSCPKCGGNVVWTFTGRTLSVKKSIRRVKNES